MRNMWLISKMIQVKERKLRMEEKKLFILADDLSITTSILTSIGIHHPTYDDCYIIREVCKTVSLRAAKLAAAGKQTKSSHSRYRRKCIHSLAIAVLINRLNMPSVTVGVDGTLFRHHEKFRRNLSRTLSRLVPRTVSHSEDKYGSSIFAL